LALSIDAANAYISSNVIDIDDWNDADEAKKQRILNVATRTLSRQFPNVTIPDEAVYEFSAVLATVFNDTNKLAQQGVSSYTVSGVASFTFFDPGAKHLYRFIPPTVVDLINDVNDKKVSLSNVKWTVL
jgi:hypothetical protein